MSNSSRFKQLEQRLLQLKRHFLPPKFNNTGNYEEVTLDRTRAYRLLVHAEFESYLEDITLAVVAQNIKAWRENRTPSAVIISLLACYHSGWVEFDDENNQAIIESARSRSNNAKLGVKEIIQKAEAQYRHNLKNNHGIREANLSVLLTPIGIGLDQLDSTWVADIDSFGQNRGETAHSSKAAASTQINPKDEYRKVSAILSGIKDLDQIIVAINNGQSQPTDLIP